MTAGVVKFATGIGISDRTLVGAAGKPLFKLENLGPAMNVNHVYASKLMSGQSVVSISGYVNRESCDYAMERLEEFVFEGADRIVFDCSDVRNLPQWWFVDKIRDRFLGNVESGQILVRCHSTQESLKAEPA